LDTDGMVSSWVADLSGELFAEEFQYWSKIDSKRKK
jgi:hypothetical protein